LRVEIGSVMVSVIPMRRWARKSTPEPTKIVRLGQRGAVSLAAALAVPQVSDQVSHSPAAT
jgi:NhaP-type Na+/H+ or K+/H+ antiporter